MGRIIACIGSGNMGSALMKGALRSSGGPAGGPPPELDIIFTDADRGKAEAAAEALGGRACPSNAGAAEEGDFLFLAVKPQALQQVLEEIAPVLRRRAAGNQAALVSMAAGWSIEKIRGTVLGAAGGDFPLPVIRIMPNTPALVSKGMIALAASPETGAETLAEAERLLGAAGMVDRLPESFLDAVTGLSGSGPAFVYLFIEALADGGVRAGLPRDKALRYAAQTVFGSAAMVLETGRHPGVLKDEVCSPGGTTIAGIAALEKGAFRGTVIGAVEAAWRRSLELG